MAARADFAVELAYRDRIEDNDQEIENYDTEAFLEIDGKVYSDPDDSGYRLWDTLGDRESVKLTKWGAGA